MALLTAMRGNPLVSTALSDARHWCAGHLIEEKPALRHAVQVANTVLEHHPHTAPELVAAALLRDAPEFAPQDLDLLRYLTATYGDLTARLVLGLHAEHEALDQPNPPIDVSDKDLLLLSTVDKAVAFRGNLQRARLSGDAPAYFAAKTGMIRLRHYFWAFQRAGLGLVPAALSTDLAQSLVAVDEAVAAFRARG